MVLMFKWETGDPLGTHTELCVLKTNQLYLGKIVAWRNNLENY